MTSLEYGLITAWRRSLIEISIYHKPFYNSKHRSKKNQWHHIWSTIYSCARKSSDIRKRFSSEKNTWFWECCCKERVWLVMNTLMMHFLAWFPMFWCVVRPWLCHAHCCYLCSSHKLMFEDDDFMLRRIMTHRRKNCWTVQVQRLELQMLDETTTCVHVQLRSNLNRFPIIREQ